MGTGARTSSSQKSKRSNRTYKLEVIVRMLQKVLASLWRRLRTTYSSLDVLNTVKAVVADFPGLGIIRNDPEW